MNRIIIVERLKSTASLFGVGWSELLNAIEAFFETQLQQRDDHQPVSGTFAHLTLIGAYDAESTRPGSVPCGFG